MEYVALVLLAVFVGALLLMNAAAQKMVGHNPSDNDASPELTRRASPTGGFDPDEVPLCGANGTSSTGGACL